MSTRVNNPTSARKPEDTMPAGLEVRQGLSVATTPPARKSKSSIASQNRTRSSSSTTRASSWRLLGQRHGRQPARPAVDVRECLWHEKRRSPVMKSTNTANCFHVGIKGKAWNTPKTFQPPPEIACHEERHCLRLRRLSATSCVVKFSKDGKYTCSNGASTEGAGRVKQAAFLGGRYQRTVYGTDRETTASRYRS